MGTYLLSRAASIVDCCWWAANNNWFDPKILLWGMRLLLWHPALSKPTRVSWSFVLTRCCVLTWETKILMRAISNVHAGCRFPNPALNKQHRLGERRPKLSPNQAQHRINDSQISIAQVRHKTSVQNKNKNKTKKQKFAQFKVNDPKASYRSHIYLT